MICAKGWRLAESWLALGREFQNLSGRKDIGFTFLSCLHGQWELDFQLMRDSWRGIFRLLAQRAGILSSARGNSTEFWISEVTALAHKCAGEDWSLRRPSTRPLITRENVNLLFADESRNTARRVDVFEISATLCYERQINTDARNQSRGSAGAEHNPLKLGTASAGCKQLTRKSKKGPAAIGTNLNRLRQDCGWTYEQLASKTGLDKCSVVDHICHGTKPRISNLKNYADVFSKRLERSVSVVEILTS